MGQHLLTILPKAFASPVLQFIAITFPACFQFEYFFHNKVQTGLCKITEMISRTYAFDLLHLYTTYVIYLFSLKSHVLENIAV